MHDYPYSPDFSFSNFEIRDWNIDEAELLAIIVS